jgi:Putative zinc-finger
MKIRCWRLRSALTSYVDNEVSADERRRVDDHLGRCDACRHRVSREQAVRRRLRRWSAEMRAAGAPLSWPAGAETPPRYRVGLLLRLGVVSAAAIALVLVMWNRWPAGAAVPFAAHGQITDSRCASGHAHTTPALRNMSGGDCVRRCVEMGAEYVFVAEGVVYPIGNQDFVDLMHLAGQEVQLQGEVRRDLLTVSQMRPLTARRSDNGLSSKEAKTRDRPNKRAAQVFEYTGTNLYGS